MGSTHRPIHDNHALVDNLLSLHPPSDDRVAAAMDIMREAFIDLGHLVVDNTPVTLTQTLAVRRIHDACMLSIAALACHQEEFLDEPS